MPKAQLPWPVHWYQGDHDIRCIVPHCDFVTDEKEIAHQWTQLHDHCADADGTEHALLEIILRQSKCALCNHPALYGQKNWVTRALYDHEGHTHGSAAMFSIDSFVVLAREGRIYFGSDVDGQMAPDANCQELAFDRMMEKVQALPAFELGLLFQKSGCFAHEQTYANLAWILTYDSSAEPPDDDPYWTPVPSDRFLQFCRPHSSAPADSSWRRVWKDLTEKYADGRI